MLTEKLNNGKYKLSITPTGFSKKVTFEEQKDKFLYDKIRTIGFRKDKKLNKFVGIRDGYSKQLELSLVSVILNGTDKIPKKRINFNSVSLIDGSVVHDINSVKFYNEVDDTNYRNMVQIDNPFDSLEILYEVHTKGIEVSNTLVKNKYTSTENQFTFVDNNGIDLFVIDVPVVKDADGNFFNIVNHDLYVENDKLYYKKTIGEITDKYKFPLLIDVSIIYNIGLSTTGVGVIASTDASWTNVKNGTGTLSIPYDNTDIVKTYDEALGVKYSGGTYTLTRTFLSYNTGSYLSGETHVLSSAKLILKNYRYIDEQVVVFKGTQNSTGLTIVDWNSFGTQFFSATTVTLINSTEFNLHISEVNLTGYTNIALKSNFDSTGSTPTTGTTSLTGIDFNGTMLEIIYEPIKVYGQTELNVLKGDYFELTGYTNSGYTESERSGNSAYIQWYSDSGYTQFIASGGTLSGSNCYSMNYEYDNKIYAVLPITGGTTFSDPLIVTINVIRLNYGTLPVRNIDYDVIDLDSIYFKYYRYLSGVCYAYVRDINHIYEGFPLVSDAWGNESYNLYNEFDVIDEFFSNSHEVEVAYNQNLDLTKKYNELDGVILREGTRVLLTAQDDLTQLGVYVVQYDNTLVRTDEMNTYDDLFRYKAHVNAGTYFDQEIHVWPILPPLVEKSIEVIPSGITFISDSGLSETVLVLADTSWNLYKSIPWVMVNTSSGDGTKNVIIKTTMPNTSNEQRSGTIEFTSPDNNITATLEVFQDPNLGDIYRTTTDGDYRVLINDDVRIIIEI